MELLGDIWHVAQRGFFLNSDRLSLPRGEVVEEAFPHSCPFCLPVGSLYCVFVVDLEHMLKVSSPPTGMIFCSHLCWIGVSGTGTTAGLVLGVCLGHSQGSIGCYPSSPSGVTGLSASDAPSPGLLPSSVRDGMVRGRSSSV